jgi:hypothetical protein
VFYLIYFYGLRKRKKRHVSLKQLAKRFKCTKVITKNKRFLKNMFNLKLGEKERLVVREELGRGEQETEREKERENEKGRNRERGK